MGMFRDSASSEIDIIKEMAEGLGSTGLRLEDLIEKSMAANRKLWKPLNNIISTHRMLIHLKSHLQMS